MARKTLSIPVHDGRKFTWHGRHGYVEASELGAKCVFWSSNHVNTIAGRVWDDACDVGFWVKSHKTGKMVLFTLYEEEKSQGETLSWSYVSYGDIEAFTITVFND